MTALATATETLPDDIVRAIGELDPLPVTAQQLVSLGNGGDVSLARIADLVEFDQAVAASVLRLAQTTRFAGARPPQSVREAIARIGVKALLDLVMGDYVKRAASAAPVYDLSEHDQWLHGAAARLGAVALADECSKVKLPPEAETAALLHDIGKLVIARVTRGQAPDFAGEARRRNTTFVEAEREILGTDHAAVGAALARSWQFPDTITDAIARHHEHPVSAGSPVLDAVVLSNLVAKTIEAGLGAEGLNLRVDVACYRRLGLDFAAFSRACLRAQTWLTELQATQTPTRKARA